MTELPPGYTYDPAKDQIFSEATQRYLPFRIAAKWQRRTRIHTKGQVVYFYHPSPYHPEAPTEELLTKTWPMRKVYGFPAYLVTSFGRLIRAEGTVRRGVAARKGFGAYAPKTFQRGSQDYVRLLDPDGKPKVLRLKTVLQKTWPEEHPPDNDDEEDNY